MKILGILVALIAMVGIAGAQPIAQSQSTSVAVSNSDGVTVSVDVSVMTTNGGMAIATGFSEAYSGNEQATAEAGVLSLGNAGASAFGSTYVNAADEEALSMATLDLYTDLGAAVGEVHTSGSDVAYTMAVGANIEGYNMGRGWTEAIAGATVELVITSGALAETETTVGVSGVEASAGSLREICCPLTVADTYSIAAGMTGFDPGYAAAGASGMADIEELLTDVDTSTGVIGDAAAYAEAYANIEIDDIVIE